MATDRRVPSGAVRPGADRAGDTDLLSWYDDPWDAPDALPADGAERAARSWRGGRWLLAGLGILVTVAVVVAGIVGWSYLVRINPPGEAATPLTFTVVDGDDLESVSRRLEAEGFIVDDAVFRWYARRNGGLEPIPGYYSLRPRAHAGDLLAVLRTSPEETFSSVTFPEGFTLAQMATRLATVAPRILAADMLRVGSDGSVPAAYLPPGQTSLEGLLFPDTYQISNGESATQVVARMVAMMERVGRQEGIEPNGAAIGLTPYEVLIVASMIEREAKIDADRALIARVVLNRLEMGMPLQIDATLSYGQDPGLTFAQLQQIDSPYNTYLTTGLPPTPIANPGRASIRAALNPAPDPSPGSALCRDVPREQCRYLFYVIADTDGRHEFAVTLAQHEANVDAAREAGLL